LRGQWAIRGAAAVRRRRADAAIRQGGGNSLSAVLHPAAQRRHPFSSTVARQQHGGDGPERYNGTA